MGWSLFEKPVDEVPVQKWLQKLTPRELEVINLRALSLKSGLLPSQRWWDTLWVQDLGQ